MDDLLKWIGFVAIAFFIVYTFAVTGIAIDMIHKADAFDCVIKNGWGTCQYLFENN